MPMSVTNTAGGTGYVDIRVGTGHQIHQSLLDATALASFRDADGYLPPGLPISTAGGNVTTGTAYGVLGPEPVKLGSVNVYGNVFLTGALNRDAIEDNLGRVLTAAEIAGMAGGLKMS